MKAEEIVERVTKDKQTITIETTYLPIFMEECEKGRLGTFWMRIEVRGKLTFLLPN